MRMLRWLLKFGYELIKLDVIKDRDDRGIERLDLGSERLSGFGAFRNGDQVTDAGSD
jgi:hypothetical protein